MCIKKGIVHLIVPSTQFQLLNVLPPKDPVNWLKAAVMDSHNSASSTSTASDHSAPAFEDVVSCYSFNTHVARHYFCKTCGIHSFYRPRSHPHDVDVNLRCLDNAEQNLNLFALDSFDGLHWEQNIARISSDAQVISAAASLAAK